MDILKSGDVPALVTNIEVLNILSETIDDRKRADDEEAEMTGRKKVEDKLLRHRDFIEHSVHDYLRASSCAGLTKVERIPKLVARLKARPPPSKPKPTTTTTTDNNVVKMEEGGNDLAQSTKENNAEVISDDVEMTTQNDQPGESRKGRVQHGYGLTDAETLQILNHLPITEPVEIHLMIEDLSSRMEEDRQNELLNLLKKFVEEGAAETVDAGHGEEEGEEEDWDEEVDQNENNC